MTKKRNRTPLREIDDQEFERSLRAALIRVREQTRKQQEEVSLARWRAADTDLSYTDWRLSQLP